MWRVRVKIFSSSYFTFKCNGLGYDILLCEGRIRQIVRVSHLYLAMSFLEKHSIWLTGITWATSVASSEPVILQV